MIQRKDFENQPYHPGELGAGSLAKEMRAKRLSLHMTEAELAAELGVSQPMVAMIEAGRKHLPEELEEPVKRFIAGDRPSVPSNRPGRQRA